MSELFNILSQSVAFLLSILGLVIVILTYLRRGRIKLGQFQLEFPEEQIRAGGDVYINHAQPKEEVPQEPAHRQYSLMQQYHTQGLAQAKISFWLSLVFASLGFIVIVVSLLTMDKDLALTAQGKTFVGLVAGTIIDAVSALFFVQSNKARHLMTEFFDKLRVDRKFEESLQMCERIPDPVVQSRLKVLMALNFAEVSSPESVLREVLVAPCNPGDSENTNNIASNLDRTPHH